MCDFHFLYSDYCYLGNFNTESPVGAASGTYVMYIFKGKYQTKFFTIYEIKSQVHTATSDEAKLDLDDNFVASNEIKMAWLYCSGLQNQCSLSSIFILYFR